MCGVLSGVLDGPQTSHYYGFIDAVRSDGAGRYLFEDVKVGDYVLEIEHESMGNQRRDEREGQACRIPVLGLHARPV